MHIPVSPNRVLLIPGYGTGVTYALWRPRRQELRGFAVFAHTPGVELFEWGEELHYHLFSSLNPLASYQLYRTEQRLVRDPDLQAKLRERIKEFDPEVIVAHSMGGVLLLASLRETNRSLRKIIFAGSDVRVNPESRTRLQDYAKYGVELHNLYCPWDQALLASLGLNLSVPLGLRAHPLFRSHFLPLYRTWNLHESSLHDPYLRHLALDPE